MVSHVRVRLVNGLLRRADERMSNGFWVCEGLIDGEACPREGEVKFTYPQPLPKWEGTFLCDESAPLRGAD
jgi:hypothetical protein